MKNHLVVLCYACKGKHLLKDCTACSSGKKARIMAMSWKERQDCKVSRNFDKNKEVRGKQKRKTERKISSARVLKVGDGKLGTTDPGEVRQAILAGENCKVPYRLDSGADFSTISDGLLQRIMEKTFLF